MSIGDLFRKFFGDHVKSTDEPIWWEYLGPDRILDTPLRERSGTVVVPGVHYVQLIAHRMNLRTDEFLGGKRFPVVHSQVIFNATGDHPSIFPAVAGHDTIGSLDLSSGGNQGGGSHPLTPLVPYHTGAIEFLAGIVSMKGEHLLQRLTDVVERVTKLAPAAAAFGTAATTGTQIVGAALSCVEDLFGVPDAKVMIAAHSYFSGHAGDQLRTGIYALVNPRPYEESGERLLEKEKLLYSGSELQYDYPSGPAPLRGYDWFTLEIGTTEHVELGPESEPVLQKNEAIEDLLTDLAKSKAMINSAISLIHRSSQLVKSDKSVIARGIYEEYRLAAADMNIEIAAQGARPTSVDEGLVASGEPTALDYLVV